MKQRQFHKKCKSNEDRADEINQFISTKNFNKAQRINLQIEMEALKDLKPTKATNEYISNILNTNSVSENQQEIQTKKKNGKKIKFNNFTESQQNLLPENGYLLRSKNKK